MRLFLAIDIPQKIKEKIDKKLFFFRQKYPQFQWVDKENFHITLHFFGERDDEEKIKKKIADLLWDQFSFFLYSFNLDVFFNRRLLVYLTFNREKKIEELAYKIRNHYQKNNLKFIPHLTVARGAPSSKQQYFALKNFLKKIKIDVSFLVDEVVLFESILTQAKPVYRKIATFKLLEK